MEKYVINDNINSSFMVEINKQNNKVLIYNEINRRLHNGTVIYSDTPILDYNYDNIFIGKNPSDKYFYVNSILIHLTDNIYVYIGVNIYVFKSLNKINKFIISPIDSSYGIDIDGNVYLMTEDAILLNYRNSYNGDPYDYYYDKNDERFIIKSFKYKNYFYDLNGKVMIDYEVHTMRLFMRRYKSYVSGGSNIYCYDSNNIAHKVTREEYIKMHNRFAKYNNISKLRKKKIIKTMMTENNNIIKKPDRPRIIILYMCIAEYLNNKKIMIDKHIIKNLLYQYKVYINNINLLSQCAQAIDFIKGDTELYLYASNKYGNSIKYIPKEQHTYEILEKAIKLNPSMIKHIEQTEELCKIAIQIEPTSIRYIKNKTEEMCMLAVQKDIWSYKHIGDIYETVTIYALKRNFGLIKYINNPTDKLYWHALKHNPHAIGYIKHEYQTKEMCEYAVKKKGILICDINPNYITFELCKISVEYDGNNIKYVPIKFKTQELSNLAVNNNLKKIKYIPKEYRQKWMYDIINNNKK